MALYTCKIAERKYAGDDNNSGAHLWVELRVTYTQDIEANKTSISKMELVLCGTGAAYNDGTKPKPWIDWDTTNTYFKRAYKDTAVGDRIVWGDYYRSDTGWCTALSADTVTESVLARHNSLSLTHEVDGTARLCIDGGSIGLKHLVNGSESEQRNFLVFRDVVVELAPIDRTTAILSGSNFNDEENPTITYGATARSQSVLPYGNSTGLRAYDDNVTELQAAISLDGSTPDIAYRDIPYGGGSYTFELTTAERETLREKVQGSTMKPVYFLIRTVRKVEDSSVIDERECISALEKTITIINCSPLISPTVTDINETTKALTGDSAVLIKYFSEAKAELNAVTRKRATLTGYYIKNGNKKVEDPSYTFSAVNYNVFEFFVIDSRNSWKQETLTPLMVEYIKLTCNMKDNKPDTSGKMAVECSGNFFNDSFGAVTNALMVQYRYKKNGTAWLNTAAEWKDMDFTLSGDTYTATAELTGLDYKQSYVFETRATDLLMTISSGESALKSLPVFHWGAEDFVHETPVKFNEGIDGDVQFTGNIRLKPNNANYGSKIFFGDSSYASIAEGADDELTIDATKLHLSAQEISLGAQANIYGGLSLNGGSIAFGSWTPTLNKSGAVSYYEEQYGWYQKLGNTVTIGFTVKASCNSGHHTSAIALSGVPVLPLADAFGGGIAYNVYVTSGMCFEGWGINTSGEITARVQPCNNTTAKNLSIGSTVCYPSGGGSITLSGTISYMTE